MRAICLMIKTAVGVKLRPQEIASAVSHSAIREQFFLYSPIYLLGIIVCKNVTS